MLAKINQINMTRMSGFTLLEVLVALSILAISLGAIYQILGTSINNIQRANEYAHAQLIAESKISELGKGIPISNGDYEGKVDSKYHWNISVRPDENMNILDDDTLNVYKVNFTLSWSSRGKPRSIEIMTYRLSTGDT